MDNELKALARDALRESYLADLQQLTNAYELAGAGLDSLDLAELHTFPDKVGPGDVPLNIHVDWPRPADDLFGGYASCGHDTVVQALNDERGQRLFIGGRQFFRRHSGEWNWDNSQ